MAQIRTPVFSAALAGPGEVHWFEHDTDENFSFAEFPAPPAPLG